MIAVLSLGILSQLLLAFAKNKELALKWVFFIVTVFLAIRYHWGNDYMGYLTSFGEYRTYTFGLFDTVKSGDLSRNNEYGWIILNRLFGSLGLGFFGLIIALSVFECTVLYRMLKKYVSPQYYWVAVLFWIFSTSFCVNASMIRQHICISLYLIVIDLMIQKKTKGYLFWSIGIIMVGATIHRSFMLMVFTLPLFYVHIKQNRTSSIWTWIIVILFLLWSFLGRNLAGSIMYKILSSNEEMEEYMFYLEQEKESGVGSGLGMIFHNLMFIVWMWLLPRVDKEKQSIVLLMVASFFFDVIMVIVPMASRFVFYFTSIELICWTYFMPYIKQNKWMLGVFVVEMAMLVRSFIGFFYNPVWITKFMNYHTIFSAGGWM